MILYSVESVMRLFIAEKPSLGGAIAAVLPKRHTNTRGDGFIQYGVGMVLLGVLGICS